MLSILQRKTSTILMLLLAGGFGMLVIELVWMGHTRGVQLIAIITAVVGTLLALVGAFARGRARPVVAGLLAALALVGLFGTFEHAEARAENANRRPPFGANTNNNGNAVSTSGEQQQQPPQDQNRAQGQGQGQRGFPGGFPGRGNQPPLLSPLSLSGLAIIGTVVLLGTCRENAMADESATTLRSVTAATK